MLRYAWFTLAPRRQPGYLISRWSMVFLCTFCVDVAAASMAAAKHCSGIYSPSNLLHCQTGQISRCASVFFRPTESHSIRLRTRKGSRSKSLFSQCPTAFMNRGSTVSLTNAERRHVPGQHGGPKLGVRRVGSGAIKAIWRSRHDGCM